MLDPTQEAQLIFEELRRLYREAREGDLDPELAGILVEILDSQIGLLEFLHEQTSKEAPQRKE